LFGFTRSRRGRTMDILKTFFFAVTPFLVYRCYIWCLKVTFFNLDIYLPFKMRFSTFFFVALSGVSLASPIVQEKRQSAEVSVQTLLTDLYATVQVYTGAISMLYISPIVSSSNPIMLLKNLPQTPLSPLSPLHPLSSKRQLRYHK